MNSQAFISHLDCYIPETKLHFKEHLDFFAGENDSIFDNGESFLKFGNTVLGIEGVNVEIALSFKEMIISLIQKNIDEDKVVASEIDYVLLALDFHDQLIDFGHFIQDYFKMSKATVIRVSGNYCANVDVAIGLSKKLICAEEHNKQVLIITGSKQNNTLDKRIVGNYAVMGDSVGIALLSGKEEDALLEVMTQKITTKGSLYNFDLTEDNTILHYQSYVESMNKLFDGYDILPDEVDRIILHNANQLLLESSLKAVGLDIDLVDNENQKRYGHLGTTDLILNLKTYLDRANGLSENILSINSGAIGTYVTTLFQN